MKITVLDEDNIRIVLDKEDLEKYNLSFEEIRNRTKVTKESFWRIVNAAKYKSGFDPKDNKMLIEAFPKSNGEVMLYVTRLPEISKKGENGNSRLFMFGDSDTLLSGYREIMNTRLELLDKKYYKFNEKYYLCFLPISITENDERLLDSLLLSLYEVGGEEKASEYRYYLDEHADLLAKI